MKIAVEMFRLITVCGLLSRALCMLDVDLNSEDESSYESVLRAQDFSEEDIKQFLQARSLVRENLRNLDRRIFNLNATTKQIIEFLIRADYVNLKHSY